MMSNQYMTPPANPLQPLNMMTSIKDYKKAKRKNAKQIKIKKQYRNMLQAHNKKVVDNFRQASNITAPSQAPTIASSAANPGMLFKKIKLN